MTQLEIVQELLLIYERVYPQILETNTWSKSMQILDINGVAGGVCRCSSDVLGFHIGKENWVTYYLPFPYSFWGDGYAVTGGNKTTILARLQTRIEILREVEINLKGGSSLYLSTT